MTTRLPLILLALLTIPLAGCPKPSPKPVPPAPAAIATPPTPPSGRPPISDETESEVIRPLVEAGGAYDFKAPLDIKRGFPDSKAPGALEKDPGYATGEVSFNSEGKNTCTGWLAIPTTTASPFPVVLLLHGYGSSKNAMSRRYAAALAKEGIATLSLDLPYHGPRNATLDQKTLHSSALRDSVVVCRRALDYLTTENQFSVSFAGVWGYGLGSEVAITLAAVEPRVAVVVLNEAAGPDPTGVAPGVPTLPDHPEWNYPGDQIAPSTLDWERNLQLTYPEATKTISALNPVDVIPLIQSKPLLFQNGRQDPTITADGAADLDEGAGEPKTQRWYDTDGALSDEATTDAVTWLVQQYQALSKPAATDPATTKPASEGSE
ncbi:MAG: alpha/beta fold hydrolase [bacterium]